MLMNTSQIATLNVGDEIAVDKSDGVSSYWSLVFGTVTRSTKSTIEVLVKNKDDTTSIYFFSKATCSPVRVRKSDAWGARYRLWFAADAHEHIAYEQAEIDARKFRKDIASEFRELASKIGKDTAAALRVIADKLDAHYAAKKPE